MRQIASAATLDRLLHGASRGLLSAKVARNTAFWRATGDPTACQALDWRLYLYLLVHTLCLGQIQSLASLPELHRVSLTKHLCIFIRRHCVVLGLWLDALVFL